MVKSAVWLLKLAGAVSALVGTLAAAALVGYTVVVHPAWAWPLPLALALGTFAILGILANFPWAWLNERPISRASRAGSIGSSLLVGSAVITLFVAVGEHYYRWRSGAAGDELRWAAACLAVGGAYQLSRNNRVIAKVMAKITPRRSAS
jgi:hypothetical protein